MLEAKSRRGRPKGTGIDDSDRIARLAELIRNNPALKPTTAIRGMGFTDPSVIRRLRDKYKVFLRDYASRAVSAAALTPPTVPAARPPRLAAVAPPGRH